MKKIDLHMHTTVSDGTDTPEEIISNVQKAGIDLFSVTDHDAIKCGIVIPEILAGMDPDTRPAFIRGIEFSCEDENGRYHILGYGYDPSIPGIAEVVRLGHEMRLRKAKLRIEFLEEEFGFEFTEEEKEEVLSMDNPGKPHIANMMIRHGYAENISEALSKYINKKHFEYDHIRPQAAIESILRSGGIPVLAHPAYGDGDDLILGEDMEKRIRYLMEYGLQGLEAFYSGFSPRIQQDMLYFAEKYALYVTAGSDYHGKNKMIDLGWTNLEDMEDAPYELRRFLNDVEIL